MKVLIPFILFVSSLTLVYSSQNWYALRTTFKLLPITGFWSQPRTESDAIYEGYTKISDCGDNTAFPGSRYIPNYDEPNIVLIYDVNGYIAGIQSIVNQVAWDNGYLNVFENPMYQRSTIKNEEVLLTTAYFVDPEIICSKGRSDSEYKNQGTGYTLIFQNGKDISSKNLIEIPLLQNDMGGSKMWREHLCLFNMGMHYFNLNYDPEETCANLFPAQIIYEEGHLHGFVWQHFGNLPGDLWEHPPNSAIAKIIKDPPTCLLEAADTIGLSTMHVYFENYLSICD